MNKNNFMIVSGGGEKEGVLWVAKLLRLFRIGTRGSNESQECALSRYTEVTCPIDMLDKHGCIGGM